MKANLKGGNAVVRFLLAHGEKIGMVAIVACAGMLFWSAIGHEQLGDDKQPENLQQLVTQTDAKIKEFRWDAEQTENVIVAQPVSSDSMKEIPREGFPPIKYPYNRPVLDPVGKRLDPTLLTVEDLEVHGDSGLWASADPKVIAKKQLAEMAKRAKEERERKAKTRRSQEELGRDSGRRGEGRRGEGYGAESGYGTQPGLDGRDRDSTKPARAGTIVVAPRTGAQLQGYETIKADSWVTLLAKVPVEQQYQQYDDVLQNARGFDSTRDIPRYLAYQVQRAEVTDAGLGDWKTIASETGKKIAKRLDTYPVTMPDPVDPRFKHPVLTHPLPPLILREWDERVSHSSMPLLSEREDPLLEEGQEEIEDPAEEEKDDDVFSGLATSNRRNPRGMGVGSLRPPGRGRNSLGPPMGRGGGGVLGPPMGRGGGGYGDGDGGYGGKGAEMGGGGYGGYGGGGYGGGGYGGRGISSRPVGTQLADFVWDHKTANVLFRYFDTTAEPGRKYRYRVRLVLADVNNNAPEQYLDKTVTDRRAKLSKSKLVYRLTDWSKPSPIASVPLPARIYLVGAKPAKEKNYNAEPEAELLIKALNSKYAAEIALEDKFSRGSVINAHKKATVIWSNYKFTTEQDSEFDFRTGITLIDFSGGEKLSRRNKDLTAPTRAVLMDASGRLFLQAELDDLQTVAAYREVLEGGSSGTSRDYGGLGRPGGPGGPGGEDSLYGPPER